MHQTPTSPPPDIPYVLNNVCERACQVSVCARLWFWIWLGCRLEWSYPLPCHCPRDADTGCGAAAKSQAGQKAASRFEKRTRSVTQGVA